MRIQLRLLIISLVFLAVILSISVFYKNNQQTIGGFAVAGGTCSGAPACNYPNANSCNNHCGCTWSGSCVATSSGCSDCSAENSCTNSAGCTWTPEEESPTATSVTTSGGGVQSVIGIFPRRPLGGDKLYSEIGQLEVEIFFAGKPSNGANVKANSSMFGEVVLKHESNFPEGIYIANVTIKDSESGNKRITYTAIQSDQYNEATISVELKPSLEIIASLDKLYYKDNLMKFNGTILNKNKEPKNNSLVKISGYQNENKIFYIETFTNKEGNFYSKYSVKHGDPEGIWKILVEVESKEKEFGAKSLSTQIIVPRGVLYYSVNFLSPLKDKNFRRGEIIPITIEIKEINEFVSGASVLVYTPSGESITLKEIGEGKYSGNYIIKPNDLIGNWFLKAEAKNLINSFTKVGGASIPIIVSPAKIKFKVLSPSSDIIYTNSRLKIKIEATYSDGSLVKGANLNAVLSGVETIPLLEVSDGIYEGSRFVGTEEVGALNIQIIAEDINENVGTLNNILFVRKRSFIGNVLAFIKDIA